MLGAEQAHSTNGSHGTAAIMTLNERLLGHPPSLPQEMLSPSAALAQAKRSVTKRKAGSSVEHCQSSRAKLFSALRWGRILLGLGLSIEEKGIGNPQS